MRRYFRADSRFAPSQWDTALLCNDVSHWLGANLESALLLYCQIAHAWLTIYGVLSNCCQRLMTDCKTTVLIDVWMPLILITFRWFISCNILFLVIYAMSESGFTYSYPFPYLKTDVEWISFSINTFWVTMYDHLTPFLTHIRLYAYDKNVEDWKRVSKKVIKRSFSACYCGKFRTKLCPWWRHQMETFSVLLALCGGNPPVTSHRSPVDSHRKSQWRGSLMVSLMPNSFLLEWNVFHFNKKIVVFFVFSNDAP